jgi:hypothetical protein
MHDLFLSLFSRQDASDLMMRKCSPPIYSGRVQRAIRAEQRVEHAEQMANWQPVWHLPMFLLDHPQAYIELAEAMVEMGQKSRAIQAYGKAVELFGKLISEDKTTEKWRAYFLDFEFGAKLWGTILYEAWEQERLLTREYGVVPDTATQRKFESHVNNKLKERLKEIDFKLNRLNTSR